MKRKQFRVIDCVLAVVCVVLTVEAAAPAAAIGNSQFFWWGFLLLTFCLPYSLISAELGTTYEGEGGLYDWVKRAFGIGWGSRVAWYYWVNFPLWMASVSVLFTEYIPQFFGVAMHPGLQIAIRLVYIWMIVALSLLKVADNKWFFNIATVFKAFILCLLGVAGIVMAAKHGLANPITPASLLPGLDVRSLSFVSVILFNFMGFEVITTFVGDMENPHRQIPQAIIAGGLIVTALYLLASFGIGVAIPVDKISTSTGILDGLHMVLRGPHAAFFAVIGVMLLFSMFVNQLSWSVGINFVARYCARDGGGMPKVFTISTKNDTPLGAAMMNGIVATILVLIAPLIPSEQLFWSFFALNLVTLLLSYVPMFPAFLRLRKIDADQPRPYKVFGGPALLWCFSYVPMVLLVVSILCTVVPLDGAELADKLPLAVGSALAILSGEWIAYRSRKKRFNGAPGAMPVPEEAE